MNTGDLVDFIAGAIEGYRTDINKYVDVATAWTSAEPGVKLRVRLTDPDTHEARVFTATFEEVPQ